MPSSVPKSVTSTTCGCSSRDAAAASRRNRVVDRGVGGQRRAHGLERDRLADAGVDRLVDRAHAPARQPADDPVLAQHRAGRQVAGEPRRAGAAGSLRRRRAGPGPPFTLSPGDRFMRFWVCDFSLRSAVRW